MNALEMARLSSSKALLIIRELDSMVSDMKSKFYMQMYLISSFGKKQIDLNQALSIMKRFIHRVIAIRKVMTPRIAEKAR